MELYIYDSETNLHLATITGESNEACERKAEEAGYHGENHGWTYSPAFGAADGLEENEEAIEIEA